MNYETTKDTFMALMSGKKLMQLRQNIGYIQMTPEGEVVDHEGHYVTLETSAIYTDYKEDKPVPQFVQNILDLDYANFSCEGTTCIGCPLADRDSNCSKFEMWDRIREVQDTIINWRKN